VHSLRDRVTGSTSSRALGFISTSYLKKEKMDDIDDIINMDDIDDEYVNDEEYMDCIDDIIEGNIRMDKKEMEAKGERISPYSKFYSYDNMLFEPFFCNMWKIKRYKQITDINKIKRIVLRQYKAIERREKAKRNEKQKFSRFEIMDIE